MEFRRQLIDFRARYDLLQKDMAEISGVSPTNYRMIENGTTSSQSRAAKRVRKYTLDNEQKVRAEFMKQRKRANRFRIPNIPDFYERLDQITNAEGYICKELDPVVLEELQYDLGVIDRGGPSYRGEFARLLKEFRGKDTQAKFAKKLGVTIGSYGSIEAKEIGPKSKVMQGMIRSRQLTKTQRKRLTKVYNQMVREELE